MHHWVISAVGIEVKAVDGIGVEVGDIVDGDESTGFWVVVSWLEVIELGFRIVVVRTVTEGVHCCYKASRVIIRNSRHAPCVV